MPRQTGRDLFLRTRLRRSVVDARCWRCLFAGEVWGRASATGKRIAWRGRDVGEGVKRVEGDAADRQWEREAELEEHLDIVCSPLRPSCWPKWRVSRESRCTRLLDQTTPHHSHYHGCRAVSSLSTRNGAPNPELSRHLVPARRAKIRWPEAFAARTLGQPS